MSDVSYGAQNNKFTQNCWTASSSYPSFQSTVCLETEMEGDGEKPHRTGNQQNWILLPSTSINFLKDSRQITFFPGCHFSILFISRYNYFQLPFSCLLCLFRLYTFEDSVTDQCPRKHCQQKKQQKKTAMI